MGEVSVTVFDYTSGNTPFGKLKSSTDQDKQTVQIKIIGKKFTPELGVGSINGIR